MASDKPKPLHEKVWQIFWDTPTSTMKIPRSKAAQAGFSLVGPTGGFCYCKIRDNQKSTGHPGRKGGGRIFVVNVENAVSVRTGAKNGPAV